MVEDDESLRVGLSDNLRAEGYDVETAARAVPAEERIARGGLDLMILDVMLPDGDGYALARGARSRGEKAMILMLTARTLEEDVVRGFEAGADDYVEKPYRLSELLARVRALLRRRGDAAEERIPLPGFRLDLRSRTLAEEPGGREVILTRTEFDLLAFLVSNRDRALKRSEILAEVWRDVVVDERTIDNFVSSLKKKLRWTPRSRWKISSLRGVGYRMEVMTEP